MDTAAIGWDAEMVGAFWQAINKASARTVARKGEWTLTGDEVAALKERSAGRCELTGLRFCRANPSNAWRRPFLPSLDRVDHDKPYSFDNCRVVCCCVNVAVNDWGDDVFWAVVESAWQKRHGSPAAPAPIAPT